MALKPASDGGKGKINNGQIRSKNGSSGSPSSTAKKGSSNLRGTGSAKTVPLKINS